MRKTIIGGIAVGILTMLAPISAHAAPNHDFRGGCSFDVVNQQTTTGQSWIGEVEVVIVATDNSANRVPDGSAISNVSCEFFINGVSQGTVCTASNGTAVTANACRFEFSASDTDTVTLCTHATIGGEAVTKCANGEITQIPPQAVVDAANSIKGIIDPLLCAFLKVWGGTVNNVSPDNLRVDMEDGDVYLFRDFRAYDCPQYGDHDDPWLRYGGGR